ncbi:hypothetical protein niasHT_014167 [Heterodera trifolii]|uniref:Uncharacterized protein n=1 Tax=Heterodera trifolii TaxID=157864 RepID=A0ABD2KWX5_9BILA
MDNPSVVNLSTDGLTTDGLSTDGLTLQAIVLLLSRSFSFCHLSLPTPFICHSLLNFTSIRFSKSGSPSAEMREHSAFNAFFLGSLFLLILPFVVRTLEDENERFANKIMSRKPTIAMVLQRQKQQKSEAEETADVDDDEIGAGGGRGGGEGRGRHVPIEEKEEKNAQIGQQILCQLHANEELHSFVDQICEFCHEFFSHIHPNTRYLCRSDCFSTPTFKKCLSIFSKPNRSRRSAQMHFLMRAK